MTSAQLPALGITELIHQRPAAPVINRALDPHLQSAMPNVIQIRVSARPGVHDKVRITRRKQAGSHYVVKVP